VELSGGDFAACAKAFAGDSPIRIVTVGSLAQKYKGIDVLLEAAARLRASGLSTRVAVVGDGKYRSALQGLAVGLGVDARFYGALPRSEVMKVLDTSDVFVLASRTEGLPRAMVEAMARGLPCIGTRVGGIPELLDLQDLVEPESATQLAAKIAALAGDPERMHAAAQRNLRKARGYEQSVLASKRRDFYAEIRRLTEAWLTDSSTRCWSP
jgi:glycosyltransferase involved in cell wall biosynthesis